MLAVFMTIENEEQRTLAEDLYLTYKSKMYGIAYAILGNREDAEDAVMDAVYNIVKNISMFSRDLRNKNESLIVIIVRNTAINRYNANKRRSYVPINDVSFDIPDEDESPDVAYIEAEQYEELLNNIRILDAIYRDVLLLKYLYEYDNGKIASITGVAEATVRVRLMRARDLLQKKLKEEQGNE